MSGLMKALIILQKQKRSLLFLLLLLSFILINLVGNDGLPELREFYDMKRSEVAKAIRIVADHQEKLIEEWNKIHGA